MRGNVFIRTSASRGRNLGVGAAVLFVALLTAGCGSHPSPVIPLFGPFAGYAWRGPVRQISAAIVVPQIRACPDNARAGTWIGAEGKVSPMTQAASFFQVGVNEECTSPRNSYYAFWSSTAEQFRPQWLFPVDPGDVIQLSMHADGKVWSMKARDETSGLEQTVSADRADRSPLQLASWHQEDISDERTSNPFPYPRIGAVRFSALQVNNRAPQPGDLTTIWMSATHAIFGPSRLRSDAFSIRPVHPSAAALHYQRLAVREDLAAYVFNASLASWSAETPAAKLRAGARSFAKALDQNISGLRSYHWTAGVQPAIDRLLEALGQLRSELVQVSAGRSSLSELRAFLDARQINNAGVAIKKRLRIGITDQSLITIAAYVKAHSS